MNLNRNQILALIITTLSVLGASTAQLTDLFGPTLAKTILSASSLLTGILSGWMAIVTGQTGMVKDVSNITGVEPIKINKEANAALARVALDPAVNNVDVVPADRDKVTQTAEE